MHMLCSQLAAVRHARVTAETLRSPGPTGPMADCRAKRGPCTLEGALPTLQSRGTVSLTQPWPPRACKRSPNNPDQEWRPQSHQRPNPTPDNAVQHDGGKGGMYSGGTSRSMGRDIRRNQLQVYTDGFMENRVVARTMFSDPSVERVYNPHAHSVIADKYIQRFEKQMASQWCLQGGVSHIWKRDRDAVPIDPFARTLGCPVGCPTRGVK